MPIRIGGSGFLDIGNLQNGVAPNCKEEEWIASWFVPVDATTHYSSEELL